MTPLCAYETSGDGPAVVMLHSFPLDRTMWARQMAEVAALGCRAVALDLPGFGASGLDALPPGFNVESPSLAAYVRATLDVMDALGLARATLLGLSLGGYVALALAKHHPERLDALVLADTRAGGDAPPIKAGRMMNQALVRSRGAGALIDKLLPGLVAPSTETSVRATVREIAARQSPEAIGYALLAMRDREDTSSVLAQLAVPTLVLVGEHDAITPPAEMRAMAEAIPRARFDVIAGAGHLSNLEAPEGFGDALARFLRDGGSARTAADA